MLNNKENAISKTEPMGKSTEQRSSSKKWEGDREREIRKGGKRDSTACMREENL